MSDLYSHMKKYFLYSDDGTFTRFDRKNSKGSFDKDGYLIIKVKGKQYKAHRLVYLYHNGEMPKGEIDHINRIRTDNRIENLRVVDRQGNINNTTKIPNKETGVVGVYIDKTNGLKKKFATKLNDKTFRFYTLEDALTARRVHYGN